jgi:hypothetical protein
VVRVVAASDRWYRIGVAMHERKRPNVPPVQREHVKHDERGGSSMEQQCVELRPAVRVAAVGRVADN